MEKMMVVPRWKLLRPNVVDMRMRPLVLATYVRDGAAGELSRTTANVRFRQIGILERIKKK